MFRYGFELRVPNGPLVASDDPLLDALGAEVATITARGPDAESLQSDAFDPGRALAAVIEPPDEDGDATVGLWDEERIRSAGLLPWDCAARLAAAIDHGLEVQALAL